MLFTPAGLCHIPAVCQGLGLRHGLQGLGVSEQMERHAVQCGEDGGPAPPGPCRALPEDGVCREDN